MPNRIIKESVTTSPEIEMLSDAAEVTWYRLTTAVDDHGRYDARLPVLKARIYPIRKRMSEAKLARQLVELMQTKPEPLVRLYEVEGRHYLQIVKWEKHQRVRATQSKFPPPNDGKPLTPADICPQMFANGGRGHPRASDRKLRPITRTDSDSDSGTRTDSKSSRARRGRKPPDANDNSNGDGSVHAHEPEGEGPELAAKRQLARDLTDLATKKAMPDA